MVSMCPKKLVFGLLIHIETMGYQRPAHKKRFFILRNTLLPTPLCHTYSEPSGHEDSPVTPVHGAEMRPEIPAHKYFSSFGQLWVFQPPPPHTHMTYRLGEKPFLFVDSFAYNVNLMGLPSFFMQITAFRIFRHLHFHKENVQVRQSDGRSNLQQARKCEQIFLKLKRIIFLSAFSLLLRFERLHFSLESQNF